MSRSRALAPFLSLLLLSSAALAGTPTALTGHMEAAREAGVRVEAARFQLDGARNLGEQGARVPAVIRALDTQLRALDAASDVTRDLVEAIGVLEDPELRELRSRFHRMRGAARAMSLGADQVGLLDGVRNLEGRVLLSLRSLRLHDLAVDIHREALEVGSRLLSRVSEAPGTSAAD